VPEFETHYSSTSPSPDANGKYVAIDPRRGRNRLLQPEDCLGLVLMWTRTRSSLCSLQVIFGISYTICCDYLKFGTRILLKVLYNNPSAEVQVPSSEKIQSYMEAIESRHPSLKNVWCTMDGLKLSIQSASGFEEQGRYYNGWTHGHYVSAVIVFCPDETIPIVAYNCPDLVHDSMVAEWGGVYDKLEEVYERYGGKCTVDCAFGSARYDFLIKSSQVCEGGVEQYIINSEATSMRQSAEWGMGLLQSSFPRMKDKLRFDDLDERKLIFRMCCLRFILKFLS